MLLPESRIRRLALLQGLGVATACWGCVTVLALTGATRVFDLKLLDWRFRLRGQAPVSEGIVVVGVDDATISAYRAWPLSRDAYALLLSAIVQGGARSVGVDFLFQSVNDQDPDSDALLAYVTSSHAGIVQAVGLHADSGDPAGGFVPSGSDSVIARLGLTAPDVRAPQARDISVPYPELLAASNAVGHTNVSIDKDGAVRRLPFFIRHGTRLYPALSLRVAGMIGGDTTLPAVTATRDGAEVRWRDGRRLRIPMDEEGSTLLDFAGDPSAFASDYSMLQVLQWYRGGEVEKLRAAFDGRLVLVGLTSVREVTEDIGTTPFSTSTPLVYVHANAVNDCLRGTFIRPVPRGVLVVFFGLVALSIGWLCSVLSLPRALLATGAATLLLAGGDLALFGLLRIDLPPLFAMALPAFTYAATGSARHLFLERRSREREEEIRQGRVVQQQFLPEALIGQTLSHYLITDKLGRGGMGVVYKGKDVNLGRPVAVKVLPGGALADPNARKRFHREARVLSRLSHPHTARLYDFDSQDGLDFLVLEFIEGQTLAERLRQGPFAEPEILRLGTQIANALDEAHAKGIVHRDLKPANVMLTPGGDAKILDFGLGRVFQDAATSTATHVLTEEGAAVGTIPYMAPETLRGEPADPRTDVYGLGMILYEMATGRRPFPDDAPHELLHTILNQEPPEPRVLNRRISPGLERVILKALEKVPARRQRSSAEVLGELNALDRAESPR